MDNKFNIKKYIKFSLASNIIFNNLIFGCCKKGNKGGDNKGCCGKSNKEGNNKGCCGKGNKSEENNIASNEEQPKNETPKKPEKQKKDYKKEIAELLEQLSNIEKDNKFLPNDKKITLNKEQLENDIKSIDSDKKVNNLKDKLNNLSIDLNNNLGKLQSEYLVKFNDINNGNTSLKLGITVDIKEEDIKKLKFKNINNVKNNLDKLYNNYIGKLNDEAKKLKDEYDNLKVETEKLDETRKNIVKPLLKLKPEDFQNIKDYNKIQPIQEQINTIKKGIKDGIDGIKTEFQKKYEINKNINDNFNLCITEMNEDLKTKIDNLSDKNIKEVTDNLNVIDKKIDNGIIQTQENLKKEYETITKKIAIYQVYKTEYKPNAININITKDKAVENYKKIIDDIKILKESFDKELNDLKNEFQKKINKINTKLEDLGLGLDETNLIDNNILDNLTFDKLTNDTISNIEKSINNAESKYKETTNNFKKECTNSLEQVKKDYDVNILNIKAISDLIKNIEENIKNIDNETKKNEVDNSISKLKTEIEEAKKKKDEEKNKKAKEEEKKRQDIIKSFKDGYEIEGSDNLTIKLKDKKFKLYFKETTFIAESENEINEKDIKAINDYKNSEYTIILSFAGRYTHYIKSLKIDDIIDNINDCKKTLNKCCKSLDHCYININIYFDKENCDDSFYDINTGQLFYTYPCFSDSSLKDKIECIVQIIEIKDNEFTLNKNRAYYDGKYGKIVGKDPNEYFIEDNIITDINDTFKKEQISKFLKISLNDEEEDDEEEGDEEEDDEEEGDEEEDDEEEGEEGEEE